MKKNFFKALALASFLLVGGNASAQSTEGIPPLDPEYAQMADEIVAQQLNDPDEANKIFTKLLRKIRNNKEALLSAGSYFMTKNVYPCANMCSKQLYELAPDYIPGLMFSGEVAMMRKDYGGAGQKFDEVLMIDSTYVPALKLNARVYKNVNPHVAVEMLERIKRIEPNNYAADKDLGDIAYNLSEYKKAVKSYDEYYKAVPKTAEALDLRSCENYLQSLYATQNFEKASAVVNEVEKFDEKEKSIHIMAVIYVERDSQKGIIIGKGGDKIKKVGIEARQDIEKFFDKKVFLELFVKVEKDWRNRENKLRAFGYIE